MLYEKFPERKFKYRNREFWGRGSYADIAGRNDKKIAEYIRRQLEEDQAGERRTMGNSCARNPGFPPPAQNPRLGTTPDFADSTKRSWQEIWSLRLDALMVAKVERSCNHLVGFREGRRFVAVDTLRFEDRKNFRPWRCHMDSRVLTWKA